MSEDRDRLAENDEPGTEQDEVEAHRLKAPHANDEGTDGDDDVEGHVLKRQG
jgi:hypothetical protein